MLPIRRIGIWIAVLATAGAGSVRAQQRPPSVLGVPAPGSVEEVRQEIEEAVPLTPDPVLPATAPVVGHGRSGMVRVVLALPGDTLDPEALANFGAGWRRGHRWTRMAGRGSGLLGAPAPTAGGFGQGRIAAPAESGNWLLESEDGEEVPVLNRVPASAQRGEFLNGYHLGVYPTSGSSRLDAYAPPRAFIEVPEEAQQLAVSRRLRLGQFLTKNQFDVWPKYLALDLRLVDKLELVVEELNAMGVRADSVYVMSGFRTPSYNGPGGGGRATLSRHMWGDAADVWIDNDGNGYMDDLNGDGSIDLDDAAVIMRAVERVERRHPDLVGGAGTYPTTSTHGPYIHIDARGYRARW